MATQFLSLAEVAQRYQISIRHVRNLVKRGQFPKPLKLGAVLRWDVATLPSVKG